MLVFGYEVWSMIAKEEERTGGIVGAVDVRLNAIIAAKEASECH